MISGGFSSQSWLIFRQAFSFGSNVRKGAKGTTVVYADRFTPDYAKAHAREIGEQVTSIPFLKRFTVFNVDQCENLPEDYAAVTTPPLPNTILPQAVARIVVSGAEFRIGGDRAFHVRALDNVQVPPPRAYFDPINGHRTALHKLCHCICLEKRLARDFSGSFGSKSDTREELVA